MFCNLTRVSICTEQYFSTQVAANGTLNQTAEFVKCLGQCSTSKCDQNVVPKDLFHLVSRIQASERQSCGDPTAEAPSPSLAATTAKISVTCFFYLTVLHLLVN